MVRIGRRTFVVFYIAVVLAMLFMYFYVQDRYGHNPRGSAPRTEFMRLCAAVSYGSAHAGKGSGLPPHSTSQREHAACSM